MLMISVEEAMQVVLDNCPSAPEETVDIHDAQGRVLAESIIADRNFPPFDRVTMDGIAIQYNSYKEGKRDYNVQEIAAAGAPILTLGKAIDCIEVMTGAILPSQTDSVIRYEDLQIKDGIASILIDTVKKGQNVHKEGSDRQRGEELIKVGKTIHPPELGVLATCGYEKVKVYKVPNIAIVSSGDELVPLSQKPLPHQIRRSNNYSIAGAMKPFGAETVSFHLLDNPNEIQSRLGAILMDFDIVILSGGVSMGKFDYIPQALEKLKVRKLFHKIKQRPGKPFWFGMSSEGKPVFALPGNPVSSYMCTTKYVKAWMRKHLHQKTQRQYAKLAHEIVFRPDLNYFAQVRLVYSDDGSTIAHPVEGNGSGDLANLCDAHAFLELPRGKDIYEKGEVYEVFIMNEE